MSRLDERTTIPVWAVLVAIPTVSVALISFGVTAWQTQANAKAVEKLEVSDANRSKEFNEILIQIKEDLAVIKTTLKERGTK